MAGDDLLGTIDQAAVDDVEGWRDQIGIEVARSHLHELCCESARLASEITQSDFTEPGDQTTTAAAASPSSRKIASRKRSTGSRLVSHQTE